MASIELKVNDRLVGCERGATLATVRAAFKPDADVVICNGFPSPMETVVQADDEIVLIRRGEMPRREQMESLMMARHTPGVHAAVRGARVGIAGVGGLGSAVAVALARVGVGCLVLADFDVVELSNLNRQQYFVDQLGQLKVHALRANLARINPFVAVEAHAVLLNPENIREIFGKTSIVVEAFDRPEMKEMLVDTVLRLMPTTTVVGASGVAGFASSNSIRTEKIASRFYLVGDQTTEAKPGQGLMAPRVGVAAHHQANQVLRLLVAVGPET